MINRCRRAFLDKSWWLHPPEIQPAEAIAPDWPKLAAAAGAFNGRRGMVMHLGDSITRDPNYSAWALRGPAKTPEEEAICRWMRAGQGTDADGWQLTSRTSRNGITSGEILAGKLDATVPQLLQEYQPQIVIIMLGTNDASRLIPPENYIAQMRAMADACLEAKAIPALSTVPPHYRRRKLAEAYNEKLRELASERAVPLIDFYSEIARRRPTDWNGTLMLRNDVHPSAEFAGTRADSPATEENLSNSGYLLRGWLSAQMVLAIKTRLLDPLNLS